MEKIQLIQTKKEDDGNMNPIDTLYDSMMHMFYGIIIIFILIITILLIALILKQRAKYGDLKIATRKKACGIIFGMIMTWTGPKVVYSPINKEGSTLVWGTSGSGKTASILRPTINSIKDEATTFCIDISGDIVSSITLDNVIIFGPDAENSAAYNVFAPVDMINEDMSVSEEECHAKTIEQLIKIASQMIPELKDGDAEPAAVYFNNGGNRILAASLISGYFLNMDFIDICTKINELSWKELFRWIDSVNISEACGLISQFEGEQPEHIASCMGKAKSFVASIVTNYRVKQFLHRPRIINGYREPSFTPSMLEYYNVFYVVNDGTDFDLFAPLTRLIVAQTMEYLESRHVEKDTHTILLTLDEYSSLSMATETSQAAKKYRKKKVRLLVLTQSIADMDLMTCKGNTASRATIDNFPYRLVLGAQDPESQRYFANSVGEHEVSTGNSQSQETKREYWIPPEDFGRLDKHLVLMHPKGHMILGKNYYHQHSKDILLGALLDFSIFKWRIR